MLTRKIWLLGGVALLVGLAFVAGHQALADPIIENPELGLTLLEPVLHPGIDTTLEVTVGPEAIGGYAHLFVEVNGIAEHVSDFQINQPVFLIQAPVPPIEAPATVAFFYRAYNSLSLPLGDSKKGDGYLEPDFE